MFILSAQLDADDALPGANWARYQAYLAEHRDRFPPSAYALATSRWYHDSTDHRCPHDAWLESIAIDEPAAGERRELRSVTIRVRLLGAYHDGVIELTYRDVTRYRLEIVQRSAAGHGDWRYDELRLATNGRLLHEIEWAQAFDTARRVIESADVEYAWLPIGGS